MSQNDAHRDTSTNRFSPFGLHAGARNLLSLVYPARCVACRLPCDPGTALCAICRCSIERPMNGEVLDSIKEFFPDTPIADAWALWVFEKPGPLQLVHRAIKYNNQPYLGYLLGQLLGSVLVRTGVAFDVVVAIPLHRNRMYERGYNQCDSITDGLSSILGVATGRDVLSRTVATRTQTHLSANARANNLRSAFRAEPDASGKRILLVDDIITSGATITAAAHELANAGAEIVSACAVGFARR